MPPDRAQRVAEIVEAALEAETKDCGTFVAAACGDDPALRAEVESLLGFRNNAVDFIEQPAVQANADFFADDVGELKAGERIGNYEVLSLVAEGGMGEVYLAQDISLGRKVALKLVKRGFAAANFIRQFRQEERILAGLTHPNIARLYGASVTESGLPFFVMEYVEGERLDEYCDLRHLSLAGRLQLFRKICFAVTYAHQHLVIHRDLKPANIRVTPEGEPKLLDFGIARLLDNDEAAAAQQTITLLRVMTPEYASPEQVRGEQMTTASDVYSLGVILYELLTGRKPYRLTTGSADEIARAITDQAPARPSTAVSGNERSAISNQKFLRRDLDNIVMMAMRKEPERRYASVALLSEDIRRHLEGRPVIARKDTAGYRTSKFIRRHKLAVAAAALVVVTLLGGIAATTWQARRAEAQRARAERRFDQIRQLARSLIFEIHDSVADLQGSTPTRQLIVTRALEYLNTLAEESADDAALQRELASAYIKVGNVQGHPANANLGDTAGALQSYGKARQIISRLVAANPRDTEALRTIGLADEKISEVQAAVGDIAAAVVTSRHALSLAQHFVQSDPQNRDAQQVLVVRHLKFGDLLGNPNFPNNGDAAGAISNYKIAVRILEALDSSGPANPKTRRFMGIVHERMGTMREHEGDIAGAEVHYRESQRIRQELARTNAENTDVIRDVAIAHEKMAHVHTRRGELAAALENRRSALEIFQRLADADPKNLSARVSLAISHLHLGNLFGNPEAPNLGDSEQALRNYNRALEILRPLEDTQPPNAKVQKTAEEIRARIQRLEP